MATVDAMHGANQSTDASDEHHQWSLTLPASVAHSGRGLSDEVVCSQSGISCNGSGQVVHAHAGLCYQTVLFQIEQRAAMLANRSQSA